MGAGDHHGAGKRERERVAVRRENPIGKSSGVRDREGGPEASGVAENPGVDRQGVAGGVELPRGTKIPGVEELPRGDETSVVTFEGDGVTEVDGRGRGGDGKSPATRETKKSSNDSRRE